MYEFIVLLVHSIVTLVRLAKPGGLRSVVAESVLVRHQLLILNRGRKRAPNLTLRIGSSLACAPSSCVRPASYGP
jgi:hypothetical protein